LSYRPVGDATAGRSPGVGTIVRRVFGAASHRVAIKLPRDFLDVRDVVDAYVRAILRFDQLPLGCAINIASGKSVAIEDILKMLLSLCNMKIDVIVDRERLRSSESPVTVGDASRARALLDWMPHIDLFDTLKLILDWHRAH
jgi:GDP-4-dehydro-6-deoxy-D-mannose reductase